MCQDCKDGRMMKKIYNEVKKQFDKKMREIDSQSQDKSWNLPTIPMTLTEFLQIKTRQNPNFAHVAYLHELEEVLKTDKFKLPYKILEGETENFYYSDLQNYFEKMLKPMKFPSLELSTQDRIFLWKVEEEFKDLKSYIYTLEKVFSLNSEGRLNKSLLMLSNLLDCLRNFSVLKMEEFFK